MHRVEVDTREMLPPRPLVPSQTLGMLIAVAAEAMFFAGLISAFLIGRAGMGNWPPLGQPRLPVEATALNTAALLTSGVVLFLAGRAAGRPGAGKRAARMVAIAAALGALFVALQGAEWVRLIRFGLTLTSSTYGSFFYVIVGVHALHALGGIIALVWLAWRQSHRPVRPETMSAVQIFWYFVVGVWPVLYVVVYLA